MMDRLLSAQKVIASRRGLLEGMPPLPAHKAEAEGGCGVVGLACSRPVAGRHILAPSLQMHNRGNGKGGGIAAAGLSPQQMRVSPEQLANDYLIQVAILDPAAREDVERESIFPFFEVHQAYRIPTLDDYRALPLSPPKPALSYALSGVEGKVAGLGGMKGGLEVRPPDVWRYFCRVKEEALARFMEEHGLSDLDPRQAEDEFVYQNTFRLNRRFYASLGEKRAFVLSHGRDMMVLKIVGYAEQLMRYYQLEDLEAHVWVAHQRYPTKGRVWHPGGAHPFIGLDEALVHNGDFANYHAVCEYLRQRNIYPLFLTDTEVSVLLFDLWNRVYGYPLEYIIEALAPTTERDFEMLPEEKQQVYQAIQTAHIHGSPDGPWFFIIARSLPNETNGQGLPLQLLGITDTSMLRPQVFALQEGTVQIGLIASEKQAIDATLRSLAEDDPHVCPVADRYWNARGGSYTDGGAFVFTLERPSSQGGQARLTCTDKFGRVISTPPGQKHNNPTTVSIAEPRPSLERAVSTGLGAGGALSLFRYIAGKPVLSEVEGMRTWNYSTLAWLCRRMEGLAAEGNRERALAVEVLTLLCDRRYDTGVKRRSSVLAMLEGSIYAILRAVPLLGEGRPGQYQRLDWEGRAQLRGPQGEEQVLVLDVQNFPSEGESNAARFVVEAYHCGWRRFIAFDFRGQRFCACGLGPATEGVRIDVYGSAGDYLGSGLDGAEVYVHGSAQDQVGQILKSGKLVIHGDVGQTFMYGAKGGEVYVLGNAAGRPLINAVGCPRVVINGTCLDYLAESFMAGDPLNGGGFVVLNGVTFDERGRLVEQETPYPGGNLFSLASGGAIYLRDPHHKVGEDQLNGGRFVPLTPADWELILPCLSENERLFGISVADDLLTISGVKRHPAEVYRKIEATKLAVLI
jgi:glutamate synthase domain-containing protein 1/glutamate synthase domain-containing protein 3